MIKYLFQKRLLVPACCLLGSALCIFILSSSFSFAKPGPVKTATVKISFINTANGKPINLRDSLYSNIFGEQYHINKLKYYVSNIAFTQEKETRHLGGYYLMNAASDNNSLEIAIEPGKYKSLQFLLGVDSMRNCSGAQTGALDPMNDMFWTWNTGYVMFKLEGDSPASTSDLNRIEHHVGGYKGGNNVATMINFDLSGKHELKIKENSVTEILVELNMDHYWNGNSVIKIAELPVCTKTGDLAKKIAGNFQQLFSIKNISKTN